MSVNWISDNIGELSGTELFQHSIQYENLATSDVDEAEQSGKYTSQFNNLLYDMNVFLRIVSVLECSQIQLDCNKRSVEMWRKFPDVLCYSDPYQFIEQVKNFKREALNKGKHIIEMELSSDLCSIEINKATDDATVIAFKAALIKHFKNELA